MTSIAVGIDVGGTGIKAALVDTSTGELTSARIRIPTPDGGEPDAVAEICKELLNQLGAPSNCLVGVCLPAVVTHGITRSAANISHNWIDFGAENLLTAALNRRVHVLNDADAAGVAEMTYGAGRNASGVTIMATLGTGIGSALFIEKTLVPNTEFGHLDIGEYLNIESYASYAAFERDQISPEQWGQRLENFFTHLEKLFSPDLFIVGGGASKSHEEFFPFIMTRTPIVPAETKNSAGIIGAAAMAVQYL
jgi:polyphosphate glucokinase